MTILDAVVKLRDDILTLIRNNLKRKSDVGHTHTLSSLVEDTTVVILDGGKAPKK